MESFYRELIKEVIDKKLDLDKTLKLRRKLCRKYSLRGLPSINQILLRADKEEFRHLKHLVTKPTRSLSGVSVVAVMTKPIKCPHGKCIMCPGGPGSFFGNMPQSYVGIEPATMRGLRNKFDPYLQVFNRLEQYIVLDHMPDKVELIIMGGTFPSFEVKYQNEFVKYALKAMNDFSKLFFRKGKLDFVKFKEFFELPGDIHSEGRAKRLRKKVLELKGKSSLGEEQKRNEKAVIRCVGMTIETRPDYANLKEANQMLKLGCTRVELGVQSVYDEVLKKIERGHNVGDSVKAMKTLKDLGFKVNAHYMIGLPGWSERKDLDGLKRLFSDERFRPDMLKIYPCIVVKGTKLYNLWKKGKFKALDNEGAIRIISKFKSGIPRYVRVMRVVRDIPSKVIEAGVDKTNLRQYIKGCRCIRCREVGRVEEHGRPILRVFEYKASGGKEFFISFEDEKNVLFGFCRLRIPSSSLRKEIKGSAIVRELHVYSPSVRIGGKAGIGQVQHRGYGRRLLRKAEEIARKNGVGKMVVISGIGVREYYRKFGYRKEGVYMVKGI